MYTDGNSLEGVTNGENTERSESIRGEEKAVHNHSDLDSVGDAEPEGSSGRDLQIGIDREDGSWLSAFRQADPSPGGIASRLLTTKLEQLGEVRGRYEIVLKRKTEYEEKIDRLEREIEEIRAIAAEILQISDDEVQ